MEKSYGEDVDITCIECGCVYTNWFNHVCPDCDAPKPKPSQSSAVVDVPIPEQSQAPDDVPIPEQAQITAISHNDESELELVLD